jgi:Penicillin-insensitive murein endopeptidase
VPVALLVAALTATLMGTATARQTTPAPPTAPGPPADAAQCTGPPGTPNPPGPMPGPPVGERSRTRPCASASVHRPDRAERGLFQPKRPPEASIVWRRSRALGKPYHGRLVRGVQLPAFGTHFVTVDPVTGTSPNRAWRRYGTDRLVRVLLEVAAAYAAAHPDAPRLVVGDLSRPRGGRFGREFGGDGHRSHQNGLDVDIFYPRRDGRERIPARVGQVDRRLAQDLVDRFVRAGARYVFVGPRTRLHGPSRVVMTLANHDDHLHVRIRPGPRR